MPINCQGGSRVQPGPAGGGVYVFEDSQPARHSSPKSWCAGYCNGPRGSLLPALWRPFLPPSASGNRRHPRSDLRSSGLRPGGGCGVLGNLPHHWNACRAGTSTQLLSDRPFTGWLTAKQTARDPTFLGLIASSPGTPVRIRNFSKIEHIRSYHAFRGSKFTCNSIRGSFRPPQYRNHTKFLCPPHTNFSQLLRPLFCTSR